MHLDVQVGVGLASRDHECDGIESAVVAVLQARTARSTWRAVETAPDARGGEVGGGAGTAQAAATTALCSWSVSMPNRPTPLATFVSSTKHTPREGVIQNSVPAQPP